MKNFFTKLAYKYQQFMQGRYGAYGMDSLHKGLLIIFFVLLIAGSVVRRFSSVAYYILTALLWIVLIFDIYRSFSKNIDMRRHENLQWQKFINKLKPSQLQKDKWQQRKTHKFVKCKKCKKTLRLPKHRGKLNVTCPHCNNKFVVNTGKKI